MPYTYIKTNEFDPTKHRRPIAAEDLQEGDKVVPVYPETEDDFRVKVVAPDSDVFVGTVYVRCYEGNEAIIWFDEAYPHPEWAYKMLHKMLFVLEVTER